MLFELIISVSVLPLPRGKESIVETSKSLKKIEDKVRGIGVAVIVNMSGL